MDEFNENIPDENIQISSPKKCLILLNKKNMFIKSKRKINKLEEYSNQKRSKNEKNKAKNKSSDEDESLKTIIKDPAILTINRIIDIRSLIRSNSNDIVKNQTKNSEKNKKQIFLYKRVKSKEKFINIKNNKNSPNPNNNCNNIKKNLI